MRNLFYKMTSDEGGAPCVHKGLLSLAICKPGYRMKAGTGDWLFGFGGKRLGERLIYVAEVTSVLRHGDYYRRLDFAERPDCIYEWYRNRRGALLSRKASARFHRGDEWLEHDNGSFPSYDRACVLLSSNFRYLGREGTDAWKSLYPNLRHSIEGMGQSFYPWNETPEQKTELMALRKALWADFTSGSYLGDPSDEEGACPECRPEDEDEAPDC